MKEKPFIYQCLDAVFADEKLPAMERNVLLALARFSDKDGYSYPSRQTLANYLHYRPEWVSRVTSSLVRLGWVTKGRSNLGTVLYRITPQRPMQKTDASPLQKTGAVSGCNDAAHKEPYRRTSEEPSKEPEKKKKECQCCYCKQHRASSGLVE